MGVRDHKVGVWNQVFVSDGTGNAQAAALIVDR